MTANNRVELVDPEGLPLAVVEVEGSDGGHSWGPVTLLAHPEFGPFRRLYLSPAQVRERHPGATAVPVAGPLTRKDLETIRGVGGPVVLLALTGHGTPQGLSATGLVRATLAAARLLDPSPTGPFSSRIMRPNCLRAR